MDIPLGFLQHWDKILVGLLAVGALVLLIRKFRKGGCDCGSCDKKCPARKSDDR